MLLQIPAGSYRVGPATTRREDVFMNLIEVKKENWSLGNGEAKYTA
jgi:hypothetical protein